MEGKSKTRSCSINRRDPLESQIGSKKNIRWEKTFLDLVDEVSHRDGLEPPLGNLEGLRASLVLLPELVVQRLHRRRLLLLLVQGFAVLVRIEQLIRRKLKGKKNKLIVMFFYSHTLHLY